MVPKALLSAELTHTIPQGSVLVFCLMRQSIQVTQEILTNYGLSQPAADAASAFLKTGSVVTTDGEMIETPKAASQDVSTPNQVFDGPDLNSEIRKRYKEAFPQFVTPSDEEATMIADLAHNNLQTVIDVIDILVNYNGKPITNAIGLSNWWLREHTQDYIAEKAAILRKQSSQSTDQVVSRVLRKAEQKMASLSKPVATRKSVDDLDALLGELDG